MTLTKRALTVGDYAVEVDGEVVGVVERKKLGELASNVVDGRCFPAGFSVRRAKASDRLQSPGTATCNLSLDVMRGA